MRENIYGPENRIVSAQTGKRVYIANTALNVIPDKAVLGYDGVTNKSVVGAPLLKALTGLLRNNMHEIVNDTLHDHLYTKDILILDGVKRKGLGAGWVAKIFSCSAYLAEDGTPWVFTLCSAELAGCDSVYDMLDDGLINTGGSATRRFVARLPLDTVCRGIGEGYATSSSISEGEALSVFGMPVTYSQAAEALDTGEELEVRDVDRRCALRVSVAQKGAGVLALSIRACALREMEWTSGAVSWAEEASPEEDIWFWGADYGQAYTTFDMPFSFSIPSAGTWYYQDVTAFLAAANGWVPQLGYVVRPRSPERGAYSVYGTTRLVTNVVSSRPLPPDAQLRPVAFVAEEGVVDLYRAVEGEPSLYLQCVVDPYLYRNEYGETDLPALLLAALVEWKASGRYALCYIRHHRRLLRIDDDMHVSVLDGYRYTDYHMSSESPRYSGYTSQHRHTGFVEPNEDVHYVYTYVSLPLPSITKYSLAGGMVFPVYQLDFPVVSFSQIYSPSVGEQYLPVDYLPLQTDTPLLDRKEYGGYSLDYFYIYGMSLARPAAYPNGILAPCHPQISGRQGRYRLDQMAYFNPCYILQSKTATYRDLYAHRQRFLRGNFSVRKEGDFSYLECDGDLIEVEPSASGKCPVPPLCGGEMALTQSYDGGLTDGNRERKETFAAHTIGMDTHSGLYVLHLLDLVKAPREYIGRVVLRASLYIVASGFCSLSAFLALYADAARHTSEYNAVKSNTTTMLNYGTNNVAMYDNVFAGAVEHMLSVHGWTLYKSYKVSTSFATTALTGDIYAGDYTYAAPPGHAVRESMLAAKGLVLREREGYDALYTARGSIMEEAPEQETPEERRAREVRQWGRYRSVFKEQWPKLQQTVLDEIQDIEVTAQSAITNSNSPITTIRFAV